MGLFKHWRKTGAVVITAVFLAVFAGSTFGDDITNNWQWYCSGC